MVYLKPVTVQAQKAIRCDKLQIDSFPFRLGRESRHPNENPPQHILDRRTGEVPPNNDFYLIDNGDRYYISREHFLIEKKDTDHYFLADRLSTCGTIVKSRDASYTCMARTCPLEHGYTIIVGSEKSPYVFEFLVRNIE